VRTLLGHGMVVQGHGFGRYQLGPAVLRLGKAILAFDDDAASRMLSTSPLRSTTGETITSAVDLKEQLAAITSTGLAQEQEEAVLGECSLAGPVRHTGRSHRSRRTLHELACGPSNPRRRASHLERARRDDLAAPSRLSPKK